VTNRDLLALARTALRSIAGDGPALPVARCREKPRDATCDAQGRIARPSPVPGPAIRHDGAES
jgi:hypothetical protein